MHTTDSRAEYNKDGTITLYNTVSVKSLTENSIAKDVIKVNDIIYKLKLGDGEECLIRRQYQVIDMLLHARIGDTFSITVLRDGEEFVFTGTFTEADAVVVP
jgi:PDZ domain-containing secreted protein